MSRTFTHRPFRHAFPEYTAYYADARYLRYDDPERALYYSAGPDFPLTGNKHFSKAERFDRLWWEDGVNRGRHFTRTMTRQRTRADIAQQLADEQADHDEMSAYLQSFDDYWAEFGWDEPRYDADEEFYLSDFYVGGHDDCGCEMCDPADVAWWA